MLISIPVAVTAMVILLTEIGSGQIEIGETAISTKGIGKITKSSVKLSRAFIF